MTCHEKPWLDSQLNKCRNGSGECIGSIGVSGGTVEDDLVVARAAAKAVAELK